MEENLKWLRHHFPDDQWWINRPMAHWPLPAEITLETMPGYPFVDSNKVYRYALHHPAGQMIPCLSSSCSHNRYRPMIGKAKDIFWDKCKGCLQLQVVANPSRKSTTPHYVHTRIQPGVIYVRMVCAFYCTHADLKGGYSTAAITAGFHCT